MKLITSTLLALALAGGAASAAEYTSFTQTVPAEGLHSSRDRADQPDLVHVTRGTRLTVPAAQFYALGDIAEMGLTAQAPVHVTGFPTFEYARDPAEQR